MGTSAMEFCWLGPGGRLRSPSVPSEHVGSVLITQAHERVGEINASREPSVSAGVLHLGVGLEGRLLPCLIVTIQPEGELIGL